MKQSGGHGQYAVCEIEVEPLPRGSGFEFAERVVGGVVPRQFIPSVEKGVRAQLERGCGGHPMVDIKVTLDRRQGAQRRLLRHGLPERRRAGPARGRRRRPAWSLLEPYDEVEVTRARRPGRHGDERPGRPARAGARPGHRRRAAVVRAHVPASELVRYPIDLRSATHGTGSFTRSFAAYEPVAER